jgi:hypothetical protein
MLHFTLREMHSYFKSKLTWVILIAIVVVAVISGPFGTQQVDVFKRIIYWAVTIFGCAGIAHACYTNLLKISEHKNWPQWRGYLLGAFASTFFIGLFVYVFVVLFFGSEDIAPNLLQLWGIALVVNVLIATIVIVLKQHFANENQPTFPRMEKLGVENNLLFEKISKELGRDLISISSQDHYLQVVTSKGSELILMRLSDAIQALPQDMGLQIHRSHWVARSAIIELIKEGGKWELLLKNDTRLPVSRNYRDRVKTLSIS